MEGAVLGALPGRQPQPKLHHDLSKYIYIYIYTHTYVYISLSIYNMHMYIYIYIYICMYVCVCMYVYIYIYIYIIVIIIISCFAAELLRVSECWYDNLITCARTHHQTPRGDSQVSQTHRLFKSCFWVFIAGGCSRRGVQQIGVVSYNK